MNDADEMTMWYGKQPIRVLVVSDSSEIRMLIHRRLNREGYSVFGVASGVEALDLVNRIGLPHVAILDVLLPGQNGCDVASRLNMEKPVPVLFMTAFSNEENQLTERSPFANDYIRKPIKSDELVARMRRVLLRAARPWHSQQKVPENRYY